MKFSIVSRAVVRAGLIFTLGFGVRALAEEATPAGFCYAIGPEARRIVVPLESTEVTIDVKPGLVETELVQTFSNHTETALEATYLYPLPSDATITHFELRYPDHVVQSVVRAKAEAKKVYDAAKEQGQKAALIEQHDASLFSTAVANFLPGETVRVAVRFIQPLALASGAVEVRFPMVTGQKYFASGSTPGEPGNAAPNPERRGSDAIAANHVYAFDIQVAGFFASAITSPSHRIRVERPVASEDRCFVSLQDEITIPDRDFVLRIEPPKTTSMQSSMVMQQTNSGRYGLLTLFPPTSESNKKQVVRPRDVVFILDRSGSMSGTRIESAKRGLERCLEMLGAQDRFQLCVFDDHHAFYREAWTTATGSELAQAREYVRGISSGGGTEMQPALAASLDRFGREARDRVVVLLTDGDVGSETTLLNLVESRIGDARLFTFGIGDAPNAALLKRIAEIGRGQARFINDDATIEREMADLFATLGTPVLTGIGLSLVDEAGATIDAVVFPERMPDLFMRCPVQAIFRVKEATPAAAVVSGVLEGKAVSYRVPLAASALRGDALEKQFGKRLYDSTAALARRAATPTERALVEQEMLATALQFQLVTELTSRVAVEQQVSRAPSAPLRTQHVSQYAAGDTSDPETIVLCPFEVAEEGDNYYTCSTICGSRIRSELRDVASSVSIVTQRMLLDMGATTVEASLPYVADEIGGLNPIRRGGEAAQIDGLPLALPVDVATVDQLKVESGVRATSELSLRRASRAFPSRLTARFRDEGVWLASLDTSADFGPLRSGSVAAVFSVAGMEQRQWSGWIDAKRRWGETEVRGSVLARELEGYGAVQQVRARFEHVVSEALAFDATAAWQRLSRRDPLQFALSSPGRLYDGLGFVNLDLLTAPTSGLNDRMVVAEAGGCVDLASTKQTWAARAQWHRQESDWETGVGGADAWLGRDTFTFSLDDQVSSKGGRATLGAHLGRAWQRAFGAAAAGPACDALSVGASVKLRDGLNFFAEASREETLPTVANGRWRLDGAGLRAAAEQRQTRDAVRAGLKLEAMASRLEGTIAVFREEHRDDAFRDWTWETTHTAASEDVDGYFRAPISMRTVDRFTVEGWSGSCTWNPVRWFTTRLVWSQCWTDNTAVRGGEDALSLLMRYEAPSGGFKGMIAGLGFNYRDALVFDDGYTLAGGPRWDAMLGYRWRRAARRETLIQVNVTNVAGRSWQLTRFSPDRGCQVMLTVAREF